MAKDFQPEEDEQTAQKKSSQQRLLLLLLLLIILFAYLYFFTGLIRPRPEETPPPPPAPAPAMVKKPLPPRTPASAEAPAGKPAAEAPAGKPAAEAQAGKPAAGATVGKPAPAASAAKPGDHAAAGAPAAKAGAAAKPAKPAPGAPGVEAKAAKTMPPHEAKPGEAKTAGKQAKPAAKEAKPAQAKAAKPAVKEAKPAHAKTAKPVAKAKAVKPAAGKFALELDSEYAENEVAAVTAKLKKAGVSPVVAMKAHKSEPMHRLFLADFQSRDEAAEELGRLKGVAPNAFMLKENGRYAVYAGSFMREGKAAVEQDRLYDKGVRLVLKQASIPVTVVKIHAGSFADPTGAEKAAARLGKTGLSAKVVKAGK